MSLVLAAPAIVRAQAQNRFALVIGNSRYRYESSLPNPKRDSADVAARFRAYGLQTELVEDADRSKMQQAIDKLAAKAKGADLAAFYYAGHGLYWENNAYMVPVDGDLSSPDKVRNFIGVPAVRKAAANAAHRLTIFDNCLNNPADGWRQTATEDRARGTQGRGPTSRELISGVISLTRRHAIGEEDDGHLVTRTHMPGDRTTTTEHVVVRMRCHDEDPHAGSVPSTS